MVSVTPTWRLGRRWTTSFKCFTKPPLSRRHSIQSKWRTKERRGRGWKEERRAHSHSHIILQLARSERIHGSRHLSSPHPRFERQGPHRPWIPRLIGGGYASSHVFEREVQEGDDLRGAEVQWIAERQEGRRLGTHRHRRVGVCDIFCFKVIKS